IQVKTYDLATEGWSICSDMPGINSYARWSPDGRYIAYVHLVLGKDGFNPPLDFEPGEPSADLMLYEVATGKSRVVSEGSVAWICPRPCWSRARAKPPAK